MGSYPHNVHSHNQLACLLYFFFVWNTLDKELCVLYTQCSIIIIVDKKNLVNVIHAQYYSWFIKVMFIPALLAAYFSMDMMQCLNLRFDYLFQMVLLMFLRKA